MAVVLAKDEVVVKSWDYGMAGHRLDKHKRQKTLTVTNKRIINSSESTFELDHEEIPLSAVKSISGHFRKNDGLWMKIKFGFSLFFCLILIGIPSAIRIYRQLKSCVFYMIITTNGMEGTPLAIGMAPDENISRRSHLFGKTNVNRFKIYTDKDTAREIVNSIGSLAYQKETAVEVPEQEDAE